MSFDYVVVGGGSAGAVLASRLTEDPATRVLLLEAGAGTGGPWVRIPLGVAKVLAKPEILWNLNTGPEPGMDGARPAWLSGRLLGGSSAINGMLVVRGHPAKYDEWRNGGCDGWGHDDLLKYFCRLESSQIGDERNRGKKGPIGVSQVSPDPISDAFLEACAERGYSPLPDYNNGNPEGSAYLQLSVARGIRQSVDNTYLKRAAKRSNLAIITGAVVQRVMIEGGRAVGVQYATKGLTAEVRAAREVILSAGTIRSPQILELSGIGDPSVLERLQVPVVQALPGVGGNLQDHLMTRLTFESAVPATVNDMMLRRYVLAKAIWRYVTRRDGMFATPSLTATAFVRSAQGVAVPDIRIQLGLTSSKSRLIKPGDYGLDPYSGFHIGAYHLYPTSRGHTHARTRNPNDAPEVVAGYLQELDDRRLAIRGLEIVREVSSAAPLRRVIRREVRPGPSITSAEQFLTYIRQTGHTCWHPVGTCRMGSDEGAVVDSQLKVRGIEGLRVVDASVMPTLPASNTNIPTIMLAERASDLIRFG